jgi:hypothetical protein
MPLRTHGDLIMDVLMNIFQLPINKVGLSRNGTKERLPKKSRQKYNQVSIRIMDMKPLGIPIVSL